MCRAHVHGPPACSAPLRTSPQLVCCTGTAPLSRTANLNGAASPKPLSGFLRQLAHIPPLEHEPSNASPDKPRVGLAGSGHQGKQWTPGMVSPTPAQAHQH